MIPFLQPSAPALAWAQRLVAFDTVSSRSNLPLIDCIADHLRGLHIPLRLTLDDEGRKGNLFATIGAGKTGGVILSGHTDTVPWEGQDWTVNPLSAELRDQRLYGRGSADMKGFIGIVVAQAARWMSADLPFAIHLAFSYDEELGAHGARRMIADLQSAGLLDAAAKGPSVCIVGEPTEMVPALAHKGVHRWRCCVRGKAAHSSLTPDGVNAVEAAARLISHIADLGDELRRNGLQRGGFDVPYSTSAVCRIDGGMADNIVPEDCVFSYEFRDLPGGDVAVWQQQVSARAAELEVAMKAVDRSSGFRFEQIAQMPAFETDAQSAAARLAGRLGQTARTTLVAFGTEAGLFQRAGLSTVVCGPGSIGQAHQADEFVSVEQLARCESFLRGLETEGGI